MEALTARFQQWAHLTPTNPDVALIADDIQVHRSQGEHVILVGHSEGTVLIPQAIDLVRSREGHPVQNARSCVAFLALASPGDRSTVPLDDYYKSGFIVKDDIILLTAGTGWDVVDTPASALAEAQMRDATDYRDDPVPFPTWKRLRMSLHSIDNVYLSDPVAVAEVRQRATTLHKECVQGSARIDPSQITVAAGDEFTLVPHLFNQNGRELTGRPVVFERASPALYRLGSGRYRAQVPRDTAPTVDMWFGHVGAKATVTIPLVAVVGAAFTESDSSWWEVIEASNGGLGDQPYGWEQGPDYSWDGSSTCGQTERVEGRTGWGGVSYGVFQLHCMRKYSITQGHVDDPVVAPLVAGYRNRYVGSGLSLGDEPNLLVTDAAGSLVQLTVEAFDAGGHRVGVSPGVGADPLVAAAGATPGIAVPGRHPMPAMQRKTELRRRTSGENQR